MSRRDIFPSRTFFGYCEDALRTLNVRTFMRNILLDNYINYFCLGEDLPRWALEHQFQDEARNRTITYHDLCPNTPMIFLITIGRNYRMPRTGLPPNHSI
ncbi:hypothetical protein GQ600_15179 [Phytophthora cactorum]|nr:hypothetical protein GQ600_15179 [Phytophthora cactorum]